MIRIRAVRVPGNGAGNQNSSVDKPTVAITVGTIQPAYHPTVWRGLSAPRSVKRSSLARISDPLPLGLSLPCRFLKARLVACGGTSAFSRAAQWNKADSRRQATHFRRLGFTHEAGQVNDADHRPAYVTSDFILELTWRAETASHRSLPTGRPPRADPGTKNPILNTFLRSANGAGGNARGLWM